MNKQMTNVATEFSYESALRQSSGLKSGVTIQGRLITRLPASISGPRGCTPILWCLCVQDSPDNPCPCNGPVIWVPDAFASNRRPINRKPDGIIEMSIEANTRVFLEGTREITTKQKDVRLMQKGVDGTFEAFTNNVWIQEFTPIRIDQLQRALERIEKHPQLSAMAKKPGRSKLVALLSLAFEVGWEIGETIDEETGLSDTIADWLHDTFGPWPF